MRTALGATLLLAACGVALAAELRSGPQVGATVPGPFEPLNLNGPDAGDESCLYCRYGNIPVAMVFAPKPSEGLSKLVRELEAAAAAANKTGEVGACVIVTDTSAATRKVLGKLADDANLKHVVLAVIDPSRLRDYELSADASETVLLYTRRVVRVNHAFRTGELTDAAVKAVADDVKKHFAGNE
jgi:hypothetical protein